MKIFYKYHRDRFNKPLITVCTIVLDTGEAYKGIAFCSLKDNPVKKTGRAIAFGRAMKAMVNKKTGEYVKREEVEKIANKCEFLLCFVNYHKSIVV